MLRAETVLRSASSQPTNANVHQLQVVPPDVSSGCTGEPSHQPCEQWTERMQSLAVTPCTLLATVCAWFLGRRWRTLQPTRHQGTREAAKCQAGLSQSNRSRRLPGRTPHCQRLIRPGSARVTSTPRQQVRTSTAKLRPGQATTITSLTSEIIWMNKSKHNSWENQRSPTVTMIPRLNRTSEIMSSRLQGRKFAMMIIHGNQIVGSFSFLAQLTGCSSTSLSPYENSA